MLESLFDLNFGYKSYLLRIFVYQSFINGLMHLFWYLFNIVESRYYISFLTNSNVELNFFPIDFLKWTFTNPSFFCKRWNSWLNSVSSSFKNYICKKYTQKIKKKMETMQLTCKLITAQFWKQFKWFIG